MDNTREKLIELITGFYGVDPMYYGVETQPLVDHLIANGVTLATDNHVGDKTHADRIRAMSDEELAKQFSHTSICEQKYPKCMKDAEDCVECLLEWLKQPVGDE